MKMMSYKSKRNYIGAKKSSYKCYSSLYFTNHLYCLAIPVHELQLVVLSIHLKGKLYQYCHVELVLWLQQSRHRTHLHILTNPLMCTMTALLKPEDQLNMTVLIKLSLQVNG